MKTRPNKPADRAASKVLQQIPNIGPAVAGDLLVLGIRQLADLRGRDPVALYDKMCQVDGVRHDPCLLDVFMAATAYAEDGIPRTWWSFTAERKVLMASGEPKKKSPPRKRTASKRKKRAP